MFASLMFVRKQGDKAIVVGVLNSKDIACLESECQFVVSGITEDDVVKLCIHSITKRDVKECARGMSIDGLLTSPIWQTSE